MSYLRTCLSLFLLLGLTIGSGIAAGRIDNRWGQPVDLVEAGRKLDRLPEEFGPWQRQSSQPIDPDAIALLQCAGSLHHIYRNRETGDVVSIAMFVGPPGPTSVHTADVCYTVAGHQLLEGPTRFKLRASDTADKQFLGTTFKANSLEGGVLRVAYAWNAGRGWRTPERPRLAFGGASKLYKLQVATHLANQAELAEHDPCREFLRAFVPVADKRLFRE